MKNDAAAEEGQTRSYRPISNLLVLSKLLGRIVAQQPVDYFKSSKLLSILQSAYRAHHSTETVVVRVLEDILGEVDGGDQAIRTLLDLSAAVDTVDQDAPASSRGVVWLQRQMIYFVSPRSIVVCSLWVNIAWDRSLPAVPAADLIDLGETHGLRLHLYVNDTQIVGSCRPCDTAQLQSRVSVCIDDVGISQAAQQGLDVLTASAVVVLKYETSTTYQSHNYESNDLKFGQGDY